MLRKIGNLSPGQGVPMAATPGICRCLHHGVSLHFRRCMKPSFFWLASLSLLPAVLSATDKSPAPLAPAVPTPPAAAAAKAKPKAGEKSGSQWVFSLLPKSLQKNPKVEMTVITEITEEGKKLPEVRPQKPVYYVAQSAGFHSLGHGPANEKAPPPDALQAMLEKSLATNGYLPAKQPGPSPGLLVIYMWGSH